MELEKDYIDNYENYRTNIVSLLAYLLGVKDEIFETESTRFIPELINEYENDDNLKIIRCLSQLRMNFLQNTKAITAQQANLVPIEMMTGYVNSDAIKFLRSKGLEVIKVNSNVNTIIAVLNQFMLDNIDKIKSYIPDWIKWEYIKNMFLMPGGYAGINCSQIQNKTGEKKVFAAINKAYKIGDKVLQLKNEPSLGIMNGDDGIILDYEKNDEHEILYIDFGGHIVQYDVADLDNLTLGYAISIHKSQGMEFDNVIIPIVPAFYIMLKPKLIYTAFTRAKRKLIILGQTQSLNQALYQSDEGRQTSLFLKKATDEVVYIDDPEIPFDTLGEEDMENISPYSFMD